MARTPRLHLGVDVQRLLRSRAGVARYLGSVLGEWARTELPFDRVTLFSPELLPADALPHDHPFDVRVVPAASARLWGQWQLPRAARDVDLLFCPAYVAPTAYGGRYVVVMHDALLEVLPHAFSRQVLRRSLFRRSACRAARVLTPSEASRRDLVRVYGLDPGRVCAIHLGVDERFARASDADAKRVRQRYSLGTNPIVLFVGKLSQRRNLPNLVRAVAALRARRGGRHLLVLAGENYLGLPLEDLARELGDGEALRLLGFVPDEELPGLYRAAETFVYPSEYEGFGIPVLEAMAAGTPAITLDNSSLSEVAGDAAVLLRTAEVEELAGALERLAADPALRDEYGARGRARAKQFTWAATARETADALADAAA
jgi:glycosyltransferase involved in cell wall biosynthesis